MTDKVDTLEILPSGLTMRSGYQVGIGSGRNVVLSPIAGWYKAASVRSSSTARINAHGNFTERSYRGGKVITIAGFAWGDTTADAAALLDEINAALADGMPGILTVDHAVIGKRWAEVVISEAPENDWDGESTDFGFTLYMTTSLPWVFGDPFISLTATHGGTISVTNTGTADTPNVRYYVEGPLAPSGVKFIEVSTGSTVHYSKQIAEGATLVIDASTGVALLDGVNVSANLTTRQWVDIEAGETAIFQVLAQDSAAIASMEVDPAWW
jgi:hypothetical protein